MIKAVIFDMDGVLVDSERFYQVRREEFLRRMDFPFPPGLDFTGSNERAIWEALVPGDAEFRQEMLLGYRAYRRLHPLSYEEMLDPQVPGLFAELKRRELKIAIASSSARGAIEKMEKAAGVSGLVDIVVSGEECPAHKPAPDIYLKALDLLGLGPEDAIAVEDSPAGIASAKGAGLPVYALKPRHGEAMDQSGATAVICQLDEVLRYGG